MKRLLLLRHAQTLPAENFSDAERKLSPKGKLDAQALGRIMKNKSYLPDMALCSTATRTRETLAALLENLGGISTHYEQGLYNASETSFFQMLQSTDNKIETLLVVGHNPVMHGLTSRLAAEDEDGGFINRLYASYAPGTLTVLKVSAKNWSDIQLYENKILDLLDPIDYNAPNRPTRWT